MKRHPFFWLLFCLCLSFSTTNFALTANFTSDVVSGCAPLVVHFTNTSTGATTYHWDLGNGTVSALTDVSGSYLTPGTYTCTLVAYNGSASSTHTMTITVYPSPTVSFFADDTSVCPGTPVNFTSTTVAGVAGAITYIWNFGDGSSSTATSPSHLFPGPGYYNITLFATNAQGCQSSLTKGAYIHVNIPPVASFSAPVTFFCNPPATASFTSTVTGTAPFTYSWSFGDGGTSTDPNPSYVYTANGTYTVKLIVTDANGCKDTVIRTSYVTIVHLDASFTCPTTACVNSNILFHNTSSAFSSCTWTFGDGWTSFLDSPYHMYTVPGTYTVKLVINAGGCTDTVSHTIIITPAPIMGITVSPVHPCPAPVGIVFTGTGVPTGSTIDWTFGDSGPTSIGSPVSHTYSSAGCYTVNMSVTMPDGCKDTITMRDTLYDIFSTIIDTPNMGCIPLTVPFHLILTTVKCDTYSIPYPYPVVSYSWNFGDGSPVSTSSSPSHIYTTLGVFHGFVTYTTANGCTRTDSFLIKTGVPPVASFYAFPLHICADRLVNFVSTSTGTITEWEWQFGDGSGSSDTIPTTSHLYTMPDTFYTVTLIVYDNGCPSLPFIVPHYITVDSPKAIFTDTFTCIPPTSVGFLDASIGATSWIWLFGDGTTSTLLNPVHNFPSLTSYTVMLTTYNFRSGCRDTMTMVVNLEKPLPHFVADDTAICLGETVSFTPSITGGTATYYRWYINDTLDSFYVGPTVFRDTFYHRGLYNIKLVITDQHGCLDTFIRTNYILVAKPIDTFSAAPPNGCSPLTVTFTDHSYDVAGAFLVNYSWLYGDGSSGTCSTVTNTHTYSTAGNFDVQEIVTDNIGCKDTFVRPSLIHVSRPHAVFSADKLFPCSGDTVAFSNLTLGTSSWYWLFGDGDTSTSYNTKHVYSDSGAYTVKLIVIDSNGCTDTANYINYIHVTRPLASFFMSDSFAICLPLNVHFVNTSIGGVSYTWDFGDGNSSIVNSPSELYLLSGLDTVILVATNSFGCKDTAYGHVNLYGYAGGFSYTPDTGCVPLKVFFNAGLINVPSVIWDFADGITSSASSLDTITHYYLNPGKYLPKLILSDNTGCQNSSTGIDTIKVDVVYAGFTSMPHPICVGQTINFKDTSHSFFSTITAWEWIINGTDTSTVSFPPYVFDSIGTFPVILTATDAWGCKGTVTNSVDVVGPPIITVCPDTTICVGDAATLIAHGGVTYTWSPGATLSCTLCNPTYASPTVVTQYTVKGTDANGCSSTDSVMVFLKTKTVAVAKGGGEICRGDSIQLFDSGATKFKWLPSTGLNKTYISDPMAGPTATITYEVIGQLASCIPDTDYVTVVVHQLPTVDAGLDQTIFDGASTWIQAVGSNIYTLGWSPAESLSCDSCYNPKATPLATTTYRVYVSSIFGCKASDSVKIRVICDASQVFVPNTFTPNGDGNNDVFYPRGTGIDIIKSFRIYNRWGELLFEKTNFEINDINSAWNGSYNGGTPRPDVYVYVVDAICLNGQQLFIKGDVTIIK